MIREVQFRGKPRVAALIVPKQGTRVANVFGRELTLDLRYHIGWMIYTGCYEPLNTARFKRILRTGMTVIDAGANIGYFTLLASRLVGPHGRVVAVEPDAAFVSALSRVTEGLSGVTILPDALGDTEGVGTVYRPTMEKHSSGTASMAGSVNGHATTVRVRTLDSVLDDVACGTVDLLKIDVDGYEWRILQGARNSLQNGRIKNVIVELIPSWLDRSGVTREDVFEFMHSHGFVERRDNLAATLLGPCPDVWFARA